MFRVNASRPLIPKMDDYGGNGKPHDDHQNDGEEKVLSRCVLSRRVESEPHVGGGDGNEEDHELQRVALDPSAVTRPCRCSSRVVS
jgi:hypothetical protein